MAYYRVRRTGEQIQNGTELYHHGILGQKWGVRRFQNADGSLTRAGRKRAMKTYDYKSSDKYKNASKSERKALSSQYEKNVQLYGKKAANKIEYKVNEEGKNRNAVQKKELGKQVALGLLAGTAFTIASVYGTQAHMVGKNFMDVNNAAVAQYAKMAGLNVESHRGFSTGFSGVARGVKTVARAAGGKGGERVKQIASSRTVRNW